MGATAQATLAPAESPPVAAPPDGGSAHRSLDRSLLHGLAWTGGVKWGCQLVNWAATLIVARMLSPSDYGLVGMASMYLGLVTLLTEFGIGATIVSLGGLDREHVKQLNSVAVLFGLAGFLTSCAAAIPSAILRAISAACHCGSDSFRAFSAFTAAASVGPGIRAMTM